MNHFHKFKLGQFQCIALEDNNNIVDIRKELVQVPVPELFAAMKTCGYMDFSVKIGFNNLLIQTGRANVLIDAGTGTDRLITNLADAGISPDDIDYLIITHGDFDHIGGIVHFTKAKIVFPKMAYDLWTNETSFNMMLENFKEIFSKFLDPDFMVKAVLFRKNYSKFKLPSLKNRIILVKEEEEFLPGFKMIFTPGHRPDHFAVEIQSDGKTLLHIADGFRHEVQTLHPEWYSIYDSYPEQMAESVRLVLKRAKEKEAVLFGAHFVFPGLASFEEGRVVFDGK